MFNFYKYSFLFIMNLSLALKIDSCSNLNSQGVYILDEVRIDKDYYYNVRIDLSRVANPTNTDNNEYGDFIAYTLEGTIEYFNNNEKYEINILYCSDFKSKDKSIKESSVTLTNGFINGKQPLSINILNSNIVHFKSTDDAFETDYQNLDQVLQDIFDPKDKATFLALSSFTTKGFKDVDTKSSQIVAGPPLKKMKLITHDHNAMQLESELTHKADNSASSIVSQVPQAKKMGLTSNEPTEALNSSEIASQSSGDDAGISKPLTNGFDGEVDNLLILELKNISKKKKLQIKNIIDNLDSSQSIVLNPISIDSKEVEYSKIIINYYQITLHKKSYNITLFDKIGGEITYSDLLINVFTENYKLNFNFYSSDILKPINFASKILNIKDIIVPLEYYTLSLFSTLKTEEKLGEEGILLIRNIGLAQTQQTKDFVRDLDYDDKLVFINNRPLHRKPNNKRIEIIKVNSIEKANHTIYYYDILIKAEGQEETFNNRPIAVGNNGTSVNLRIELPQNIDSTQRAKSISVTNFRLSTSKKTTN